MASSVSARESGEMSQTLPHANCGDGPEHHRLPTGQEYFYRCCGGRPAFLCVIYAVISVNALFQLLRLFDGTPPFAAVLVIFILPLSVLTCLAAGFIYKKLCLWSRSSFLVVAVPVHPEAPVAFISELPPVEGARLIRTEDHLPHHGPLADTDLLQVTPLLQIDPPPSYMEREPPPYIEGGPPPYTEGEPPPYIEREPPPYTEGEPPPYTEEELPPPECPLSRDGDIRLPLICPTEYPLFSSTLS